MHEDLEWCANRQI